MTYVSPEAVLVVLISLCCVTLLALTGIGIMVLSGRYKNDSNRPRE